VRPTRLESWDTWPLRSVTPPVLAEFVGCDRRTIVRMIEAGSVIAFRVGRTWRIPVSEARRAFPVQRTGGDSE
jgi:excisionase family DNA binding protein